MTAPDSCVICGDAKVMAQGAKIAGEPWSICETCAGVGATLLSEGVLQPSRHCLHLVAMEVERFAGLSLNMRPRYKRWLGRIVNRFTRGDFRALCPCNRCRGGDDPDAIPDLHVHFGVARETTASTMDLLTLRSMKATHQLPTRDGSHWRVDDELAYREAKNIVETVYPGIKPGGLADRARARAPRKRP